MLAYTVLAFSIILQLTAAGLALRLIAVTTHRLAWLMIAGGLTLMAVRRLITFIGATVANSVTPDLAAEGVAFTISLAMLIGVAAVRPLFTELYAEKRRFQDFVENLHDAFYRMSLPSGKYEYMSAAALEVFGYTAAECLARPKLIADVIHPDDRDYLKAQWRALLAGTVPLRYEYRIIDPSGRVRWIEQFNRGIFDASGRITAIEGICRDISDRTTAEQKLRQALEDLRRSNTEFQEFAHVVSHDLQEPLRMVTCYLELLERRAGGKLDANEREFIGYAVGGAKRMSQLINDLLDYSRVESQGGAFTPVASGTILQEALGHLQVAVTEASADITHALDLPMVLADEPQLLRLFLNLIGNAIKYRAADRPPRIHIDAKRDHDRWVFSIRDNGIGIEPQYFERIFVIFQRLHARDEYAGTGVGLAVARRIVERHGGRIWVESQPGHGSTFYFTLAAADRAARHCDRLDETAIVTPADRSPT